MRFAAIDFETACYQRDSACSVGIVVVEQDRIVDRFHELIRPPTSEFVFTHIHGITWADVRNAPSFGTLWPKLQKQLPRIEFFAAHNAAFDRGVLASCCETHGLPQADAPFVCTVSMARKMWGLRPTRLPDVCAHLGIDLVHHDAASDAEACARIVIAARREGWRP